MNIYDEIREERARQDAKWGGAAHDDEHTPLDWLRFLTEHLAMAAGWHADTMDEGHWFSAAFSGSVGRMPAFRRQMVRVAALAVAAIESIDRREGRARGSYLRNVLTGAIEWVPEKT